LACEFFWLCALLFFELTAFFSEFHLSRLARTKALKKKMREPADMENYRQRGPAG